MRQRQRLHNKDASRLLAYPYKSKSTTLKNKTPTISPTLPQPRQEYMINRLAQKLRLKKGAITSQPSPYQQLPVKTTLSIKPLESNISLGNNNRINSEELAECWLRLITIIKCIPNLSEQLKQILESQLNKISNKIEQSLIQIGKYYSESIQLLAEDVSVISKSEKQVKQQNEALLNKIAKYQGQKEQLLAQLQKIKKKYSDSTRQEFKICQKLTRLQHTFTTSLQVLQNALIQHHKLPTNPAPPSYTPQAIQIPPTK